MLAWGILAGAIDFSALDKGGRKVPFAFAYNAQQFADRSFASPGYEQQWSISRSLFADGEQFSGVEQAVPLHFCRDVLTSFIGFDDNFHQAG